MIRQGVHDTLEAFLEVAAVAGAREERGRIQREDLRPGEPRRDVVLGQARRQPFGQGRLADARVSDEDRVVLPAAAEDLQRALELRGPSDQGIELAGARTVREVDGVRAERIAGRGPIFGAGARLRAVPPPAAVRLAVGRLRDAVRDVVEDVEARHTLLVEHLRGVRLGLLQDGGEHIARTDLVLAGALDLQHGGLQHAPEAQRLRGLVRPLAAPGRLERRQELVERAPQGRQVGAAGRENPLRLRVVRQRVQQVLQRQVGMPARHRLAIGDIQNELE